MLFSFQAAAGAPHHHAQAPVPGAARQRLPRHHLQGRRHPGRARQLRKQEDHPGGQLGEYDNSFCFRNTLEGAFKKYVIKYGCFKRFRYLNNIQRFSAKDYN